MLGSRSSVLVRRAVALALSVLGLFAAGLPAARGAAPTITTITGGLPSGLPGPSVSLKASALAFDREGRLFFTDPGQGVVWRLDRDGRVHPVAGSGRLCLPDPDRCRRLGEPAHDAFLSAVSGIAVGPDGDLYVSENRAHIVRRIDMETGVGTVFAGNGELDWNAAEWHPDHEGAPATDVPLRGPGSLAFDSKGNLYVADVWHRRVRRVTPEGTISTVAGCGSQKWPGCFFHAQDGAPIESTPIGANAGINGNGWGIAISPTDELFIADAAQILKVDESEQVYRVVAGKGFSYAGFPGEGEDGPAIEARFSAIVAMVFSPRGDLYLMEGGGLAVEPWNRVQMIEAPVGPDAIVRHVGGIGTGSDYGGDGGPATRARFAFSQPTGTWTGQGVAVDPLTGDVYLGDVVNNRVRRIRHSTGIVTTVAGNGYGGAASYMIFPNDFQPVDGLTRGLTLRGGHSGDGGQAKDAQLFAPADVEADRFGNVYVLDRYSNRVRKIAKDGTISTVAGAGCVGEDCWEKVNSAALGDGGPATAAQLHNPTGIALDRTGTQLYIVDSYHDRVRQVNMGHAPFTVYPVSTRSVTIPPGAIDTVFGPGLSANLRPAPVVANYTGCSLLKPYCGEGMHALDYSSYTLTDVAADALGNLYVADAYVNQVVKADVTTGIVTTVAGVAHGSDCEGSVQDGPGRASQLCGPTRLTVGPDGNLYVTESHEKSAVESLTRGYSAPGASRVRKVALADPTHRTTLVAGAGPIGLGGDGGDARAARLAFPSGVAVAKDGTVYISDTGNSRVRRVTPAGVISSVAGTGEYRGFGDYSGCDYSGDGGAPTEAELCAPLGVSIGPDGTLYVADSINNRVRAIRGL